MTDMGEQTDKPFCRGRRAVLAGIASGATAGMAGCLTTMPSLGQQVQFGRVDEPPASPPVYRDWVPEQLPERDRPPSITYTSPDKDVSKLFPIGRGVLVAQLDYLGVPFSEFDHAMSFGDVAVALGPIDPDVVAETVDQTGYTETEPVDGLVAYGREDTRRTVAVGDGVVIGAGSGTPEQRRQKIKRVQGARRGDVPRLAETNATFDKISQRVGVSPFFNLTTGGRNYLDGADDHPDSDWWTMEFRFDDDYVYFIHTHAYPKGETADRRYIEETVYDSGRAPDTRNIDIRIDGRFGVIVEQLAREVYTDGKGQTVSPHITWGIEDSGDVTIVHEAGDSVDADILRIKGRVRGGRGREPLPTQFSDMVDSVTVGDRAVLPEREIAPYEEILLMIDGPDVASTGVLFSYSHD